MSEYQSYEFRALDRPLDKAAQAALRALSTRAQITPTSFSNVYNYGDFRGDPHDLMRRWFDVFAYFANWGTRWCMARLPLAVLPAAVVAPYEGEVLRHFTTDEHLVLEFVWPDEPPDDEYLEDSPIDQVAAVRQELAAGDLRPLFIGWLAGLPWLVGEDEGEGEDDVPVPPVPAGLRELSEAQQTLADFLYVDPDLLTAAAEESGPLAAAQPTRADMAGWLAQVPLAEKDGWLLDLMAGGLPQLGASLRTRFLAATGSTSVTWSQRTVGQLGQRAAEVEAERERREAAAAERRRLAAERAAREARAKHLAALVGQDEALWRRVDSLIGVPQPKSYAEAVEVLRDLRDLAQQDLRLTDFEARVQQLRDDNARKKGLLTRLDKAGL